MKRLADIPLSVLDLAPICEDGTIADSFRNSLDLAQHVERWGYKRFWLAEHHGIPGVASAATSVLIGHVAQGTTTLRIGSGGIMLPNHPPLVIAEQFGTLETLYPGRIDLGLGRAPGSDRATAHALGRDPTTADSFPEHVHELRTLLGDSTSDHKVKAIPGTGTHVPIWLLGSSTFSAQLAAAMGLPFAFAAHFAPRQMQEALHLYRTYFQPSKDLAQPYAMVGLPVIAADTDAEAERLATSALQSVLGLIRHKPVRVQPPVDRMDGLWDASEKAAVASFFGAAIIGGPETVKQKLEETLAATQADEFILNSQFYHHTDRLRSYEIVSQL
ncbi:LLM class flavin-dependent oxidoreductase [Luteolibacter sp. LG18]|uniref:LLM class flavin-dependent oxidoreductase n=1 Tax=Luteolibacter sp. LG18 TaxID=2819286 RepID=UPI002B30548D|nr:hypothetical protein llg_37320 [Luteolibacter sp. LG18]